MVLGANTGLSAVEGGTWVLPGPDLPPGWEQDEGFCSSWAPRWASSWLGAMQPGRQARPHLQRNQSSHQHLPPPQPTITSEVAQQVFLNQEVRKLGPVHMGLECGCV